MIVKDHNLPLLQDKLYGNMVAAVKEGRDARLETYQTIEKYLQKESDRTQSGTIGQQANRGGDKTKMADTEVAICHIQRETALAYYQDLFLTGYPIFSVVGDQEEDAAATMLAALCSRDQETFGWHGNILDALGDALDFNMCAAEVTWATKRVPTIGMASAESRSPGIENIIAEGNQIKRLNPYNTFWDTRVEPSRAHIDGDFIGYVEAKTYIALKRLMQDLDSSYLVMHNIKAVFNSTFKKELFFVPKIRRDGSSADFSWDKWFGFSDAGLSTVDLENSVGVYEVTTMYARLIPREWKLRLPSPKQPQIFKLIFVNGHLLYLEPLMQNYPTLPIVIGQLSKGADKKSFVEFIMDLQDMATSMSRGTMDSMRRQVADRALYDPTRIRKQDIDSPNPVAKIPVRSNTYQQDIRTAFMHIPYEDRFVGLFQQNLNAVQMLADFTTGQNRGAQGQFQRGNKTMEEFQTIMSRGESRMLLGAHRLEDTFFGAIKDILLTNYLIFSQAGQVDDFQPNKEVQIDPAVLRERKPKFKIASGLTPAAKLGNLNAKVQAINMIAMDPILRIEYNLGKIITSIVKVAGFTDLEDFRRTPEEQQQALAMLAANTIAEEGGQNAPGNPQPQG